MKTVGATVLGGLPQAWAVWTFLGGLCSFGRFVEVRVGVACSQISTSSQRLHEQSDRRTRLVILVKNMSPRI